MGTGHAVPLDLFDVSWAQLAELDSIYRIVYVPLDTPERDTQFAVVQQLLGEMIDPRWDFKDGHIPQKDMEACVGYEEREIEKDLSWIYDLPMVRRFYGTS